MGVPANTRLQFKCITETETLKAIDDLENKNSSGHDGISNKLLKLTKKELSKSLTLTLWNPRATTVDSPPFCRPDHGRPESTQEFIIIVYLRLRNRMRYAWTSHLAIDINAHTRIGVCLTYNIAFE